MTSHHPTHVATLVVAVTNRLDETLLARAAAALPAAAPPRWLAPSAVDLPFAPPPGSDNARWAEAVRGALSGASVDVVVQALAGRRKRLLITDMDSTVIEQECIDEMADAIGLRAEIAAITARSMRGEIVFEQSFRERVALLRGLELAPALEIVTGRITLMPGALTLVRTLRTHGVATILASGGFTQFTGHVAGMVGFDRHYGNVLDLEDGRLTGHVAAPIFGRAAKRDTLVALRAEFGLRPDETIAVGDGANDLDMLAEAGLGVAFRAKPAVAAAARARIDHGDLSALLFLQGYAATEFVT